MPGLAKTFRDIDRQQARQQADLLGPPQALKAVLAGHTFRTIGNKVLWRPSTEPFAQTLVHLLKITFGNPWLRRHQEPGCEEHVVMRWLKGWYELARRTKPPGHQPGEVFSARATGDAKCLLVLADDLYRLQLVRGLPRRVLERLRDPRAFQGARYEVAIAATFVRCGFEITWANDKDRARHCEFVARQKATGENIAVEAKSRHRPGVLNERGELPEEVRVDVKRLFSQALKQNPGDGPFAVFIDLNLPQRFEAPSGWIAEVQRMLDDGQPQPTPSNPAPFTFLAVTNFSWHYDGDRDAPGVTGECAIFAPNHARHPWKNPLTSEALQSALFSYGDVPPDE
jgi:hypothetical protein